MKRYNAILNVLIYITVAFNLISAAFIADSLAEEAHHLLWAIFGILVIHIDTTKEGAE